MCVPVYNLFTPRREVGQIQTQHQYGTRGVLYAARVALKSCH